MLDEEIELSLAFEKVVHRYIAVESEVRDYGTGQLLTQREIHTIALIGSDEGLSLSELASACGITKGAASQAVSRLIKKGLVAKATAADSEARIELTLTPLGYKAFEGHTRFHQEVLDTVNRRFFDELKEADLDLGKLIHFCNRFVEILDEAEMPAKSKELHITPETLTEREVLNRRLQKSTGRKHE